MKAVLLAAGYATRLYPLTINTPKPLLQVGDKSIIGHIIEQIDKIPEINEIFIVTNDKFYTNFLDWAFQSGNKKLRIINDGTQSNEDRLGAVGDINFVIKQENINDDLLVIAGDNLFGFELTNFVHFFNQKESSIVAFYDLQDKELVKEKFGVGLVDNQNLKVTNFEEKPVEPKSSLAATACYLFKKEDLIHANQLVEEGGGDSPGQLLPILVERSNLHGFVFTEHWFDIGSHEGLEEARKFYLNQNESNKLS